MADKEKDDLDKALDGLQAKAPAALPPVEIPGAKVVKKPAAAPVLDNLELTDEEKTAIEKEAAAEVAKEIKEQKRKEYKELKKQELKKQQLFRHGKDETGDKVEAVTINLAPHAPFIRMDNDIYYQGMTYRLGQKKAASVKDMAFRTWLHDAEINGLDMNGFLGRQKIRSVLQPDATMH